MEHAADDVYCHLVVYDFSLSKTSIEMLSSQCPFVARCSMLHVCVCTIVALAAADEENKQTNTSTDNNFYVNSSIYTNPFPIFFSFSFDFHSSLAATARTAHTASSSFGQKLNQHESIVLSFIRNSNNVAEAIAIDHTRAKTIGKSIYM